MIRLLLNREGKQFLHFSFIEVLFGGAAHKEFYWGGKLILDNLVCRKSK